jgi:predicted MFS family arabinose efflux permease
MRELLDPEVSASIAIGAIWLAVALTAILGPDLVSTNAGAQTTTVPSAVIVALFAFLATWVLARHAFRDKSG